jgi:hypothetical protein
VSLVDLRLLGPTIDLWMCMWDPAEQLSFETALLRAMTDPHPRPLRLLALAACHVIGTPRLLGAAARIAEARKFTPEEIRFVEGVTVPHHNLLRTAARMRGNVLGVELLLARVASGFDPAAHALLDYIDVRDLVAVARTTLDARLFAEVERRIARRGKYQRGRAANLLGFSVRRPAATSDRAAPAPPP